MILSKKKKILTIFTVLFLIGCIFFYFGGPKEISMNHYHRYDNYGLINEDKSPFEYLNNSLDINGFELNSKHGDFFAYINIDENNEKLINNQLINCNKIIGILMTVNEVDDEIVGYHIEYVDNRNRRVFLDYTDSGRIIKTIGKNFVVTTVNYDFAQGIILLERKLMVVRQLR